MVIQGPPGTGKSQTIVNLIATALGAEKRVLFVSEKMAALDVVKRRLDQIGLGAACLELHSNRTNKKSIIEELRRTALGESPSSPRPKAELSILSNTRDRLNAYCKAVNEPIGATGETPCTVHGKLLGAQACLNGIELPTLQMQTASGWTAEDVVRRTRLVAQLQDRVSRSGIPARHPFWGSQLTILLPADRDDIHDICLRAEAACCSYATAAASLARTFSIEAPTTVRRLGAFLQSVQYILHAPELTGVNLSSAAWIGRELQVRQTLVAGRRYRNLRQQFESALRSEAWTMDVSGMQRDIADLGNCWWRWLSGRWRRATKALARICATQAPRDQKGQLALLDAIQEASARALEVVRASDAMASLFGRCWQGIDSDWDLLDAQANWVMDACKGIREGTLANWCLDPSTLAVDRMRASEEIRQLEAARRDYGSAVCKWAERLQIDESRFAEGSLSDQDFQTLRARWDIQSRRIEELHALVAFNQISVECWKNDLESIATIATTWEKAGTLLLPLFERARSSALLRKAFQE